ncbi:MAG: hypothetical protein EOP07_22700 [Proteobacteria bacterium]|nr:MAG: hypothetical protein EOP07_22700 [Pseudomonadota bacterium]
MQIREHFNRSNLIKFTAAAVAAECVYYYFKTRRGSASHAGGDVYDSLNSDDLGREDFTNEESRIDLEMADSFPASDPPSRGHSIARITM